MIKMNTNYFYKHQGNQYDFIRIPKQLVTGEDFSSLSISAKILYGLMIDRMGMSSKNEWIDADGKVYIIYPISEIEEDLKVSRRKVSDYLRELQDIGLIQKRQIGCGMPNQIYVKNFIVERDLCTQ